MSSMTMHTRYVIDSVSLINYFNVLFEERSIISDHARHIISSAFNEFSAIKLVIPSTVFIEIHTKFFTGQEIANKFYFELYHPIRECPDIEIKPLEKEVIDEFINIDDSIVSLEHNDKLILAAALQLNCPIITIDPEIIEYIKKSYFKPGYIE